MSELPKCNNCGSDTWTEFYTFDPERDDPTDRSEARYVCRECDAEGKVFDGPGSIIYSGAMR